MTKERIEELKQSILIGRYNSHDLLECLDEIERLQSDNQILKENVNRLRQVICRSHEIKKQLLKKGGVDKP